MLALRFVALFFVFPAFAALPAVSVAEATPCSGTFLPDQRFLFALPSGDASAGTPRLSGIAVVSETIEEASQRGRTAMMVLQGGADLDNPAIYPPAAMMDNLKYQQDVGPASPVYDEVWTAVKAQ